MFQAFRDRVDLQVYLGPPNIQARYCTYGKLRAITTKKYVFTYNSLGMCLLSKKDVKFMYVSRTSTRVHIVGIRKEIHLHESGSCQCFQNTIFSILNTRTYDHAHSDMKCRTRKYTQTLSLSLFLSRTHLHLHLHTRVRTYTHTNTHTCTRTQM